MYNDLVHDATIILYGQRTKNLRPVGLMNAASELKKIRESLRLTVRQLAIQMGAPDAPNTYGYYESKAFAKKPLPLGKAREIARAFEALKPRSGALIIPLTGLELEEGRAEIAAIERESPPRRVIAIPVTLPNVEQLTGMFDGMLGLIERADLADELSSQLAELLPDALARTLGNAPPELSGASAVLAQEDQQPLSNHPSHQ